MKPSLTIFMDGLRACGLALLLGVAPNVWAQNSVVASAETWIPRSTPGQGCKYFNAFKDNGDGTVTDPRSATVWQRCVIGQTWNGMECVGQAKEISWADAFVTAKADRFLKQTDWRLPTKNDAESVVSASSSDCGSGFRNSSVLLQASVTQRGAVFWTSTPHEIHANYVWYVSFAGGTVNSNMRSGNLYGRLVRAGLPSSADEFNREFVTHEAILADAKRKEQLEREQATAKAAAEARLEREAASKAAEAARRQREYENSAAGKAEKRKQEREAAVQAQRERMQAAAQQQQERDQAAANAASEAQACGRLYAGKPVSLRYTRPSSIWGAGGTNYADAIIVGVGRGSASARVIGGDMLNSQGYGVNSIHERLCTDF